MICIYYITCILYIPVCIYTCTCCVVADSLRVYIRTYTYMYMHVRIYNQGSPQDFMKAYGHAFFLRMRTYIVHESMYLSEHAQK